MLILGGVFLCSGSIGAVDTVLGIDSSVIRILFGVLDLERSTEVLLKPLLCSSKQCVDLWDSTSVCSKVCSVFRFH